MSITPLSMEHFKGLFPIVSEPETMKNIAQGVTWKADKLRGVIKNAEIEWKKNPLTDVPDFFWAIIDLSKQVAGLIQISWKPLDTPQSTPVPGKAPTLRIFIGKKYQGHGLGTIAGNQAINYFQTYFADLAVYGMFHTGNIASQKLLYRLGFIDTGRVEKYGKIKANIHVQPPRAEVRNWNPLSFPRRSAFMPEFHVMLRKLIDDQLSDKDHELKQGYIGVLTRRYPVDILFADAITDWVGEEERMKCVVKKEKSSPIEFYLKHPEIRHPNPLRYRELLYKGTQNIDGVKGCNLFNISFGAYLLNRIVKDGLISKELSLQMDILDPAAGWGDRLGAACLVKARSYWGWDTNTDLQPTYKTLSTMYAHNGLTTKTQVLPEPFESSNVPLDYFNVAMTSPPFHEVELYQGAKTSTALYKNKRDWINKYYNPMWRKVQSALKSGGIAIAYIAPWMFDDTNKALNGMTYVGKYGFTLEFSDTQRVLRDAYVWKKPGYKAVSLNPKAPAFVPGKPK